MREIEVKGKQYAQTRYSIEALAWATNRRGHTRWASEDVPATVYNYLVQNHVDLNTVAYHGQPGPPVSPHHLAVAMKRLVESGFAKIKTTSGRYNTIIEFEFAADVILTGHTVNKIDPIERLKTAGNAVDQADRATAAMVAARPMPELPMPELPFKSYRHEELTDLLTKWQKTDAEAHADYIDRLIETLKVVVDG